MRSKFYKQIKNEKSITAHMSSLQTGMDRFIKKAINRKKHGFVDSILYASNNASTAPVNKST